MPGLQDFTKWEEPEEGPHSMYLSQREGCAMMWLIRRSRLVLQRVSRSVDDKLCCEGGGGGEAGTELVVGGGGGSSGLPLFLGLSSSEIN